MKQRMIRIAALLSILLALSGCKWLAPQTTAPTPAATGALASPAATLAPAQAVSALLDAREQAVTAKDGEAYLATVLPSDAFLYKEEQNLIRAAKPLDVQDYTLKASAVRDAGGGILTAKVTQRYRIGGEEHSSDFTARFVHEGGRLYWGGPAFLQKTNDRVRVSYTGGDADLAQALLNSETKILDRFREQLGFEPKGLISVKLFEDQQVFLQSVKLDLPDWVGGWHEYGESIKTFTGGYGSDPEAYESMLAHESTHRMVSELSNDNACYWLQEGMAGVYEEHLLNPDKPVLSTEEDSMQYTAYAQQKTIDLEKIGADERDAVSMYYATSKAFAAFLLDSYGWEKLRAMLEYMQKYELIPVTGAEKLTETNERTAAAIEAVMGLTDEDFQAKFDQWIAERKN